MFKKIIATSILLAASSSSFALAPYLGASAGIKTNTAAHENYRGVEGKLFAGFGGVLVPCFYLAGEAFIAPGSIEITDNRFFGNSARSTYGYGASIIPGITIGDHTMLYGRLGVVQTRFDKQDKTLSGGQGGLGIQTSLTPCWDIRTEYVYTAYNSGGDLSNPKSDEFNFGVVYKFE